MLFRIVVQVIVKDLGTHDGKSIVIWLRRSGVFLNALYLLFHWIKELCVLDYAMGVNGLKAKEGSHMLSPGFGRLRVGVYGWHIARLL